MDGITVCQLDYTTPAKAGGHHWIIKMYFVYLLASQPYGTLYVGMTTDLARRVWEHKNKLAAGFTATYGVDQLVWYEIHEDRDAALQREKRIKEWKRDWKINLIEAKNRRWIDRYGTLPS